VDELVRQLRSISWWPDAIENLRAVANIHGAKAQIDAEAYGGVYKAERGAMIVDVVASRRRTYLTRVKKIVVNWKALNEQHSIRWLSEHPVDSAQFGLSDAEAVTIHEVATNLRAFIDEQELLGADGEDAACTMWAEGCGELEHAPRLDPVVGCVKGIGLALFAYMRMRSGADAIKPDVRVMNALKKLGFVVPTDDNHAILVIAKAAATEIGVSRLVLDQLLWQSGS
jgi:hypothetical protein